MKLKPCPFCGSSNLDQLTDRDLQTHKIYCVDCNASGPEVLGKIPLYTDKGVNLWNERVNNIEKDEQTGIFDFFQYRPIRSTIVFSFKECVDFSNFNQLVEYLKETHFSSRIDLQDLVFQEYKEKCDILKLSPYWNENYIILYKGVGIGFCNKEPETNKYIKKV